MIDLESALHANEHVVPGIYEAIVEPQRWDAVVTSIVEFLHSKSGMITVSFPTTGQGRVLSSAGFADWTLEAWEARHSDNEWVQLAAAVPAGQVLHAGSTIPVEQMLDTPMGRELLEPQGIADAMGVKMTDSPLFVGALSAYSDAAYRPESIERLAFLAPHLARGLALHQRIWSQQERTQAFEGGLDALSAGIVLLRPDSTVLYANAAAGWILEEDDGISLHDECLCLQEASARRSLEDAVRDILQPAAEPHARGGLFRVPRASGRRPYHVVVSPAVRSLLDPGASPAVLLWITDPDSAGVPTPETISTLLGLTPSESRIAAAIAGGTSVRSYAAQSGIKESTARWTLKQVLAKTGTPNQTELVRLILQGIPSPPF